MVSDSRAQGSAQEPLLDKFAWNSSLNVIASVPQETSLAEQLADRIANLARSSGAPGTRLGSKDELREIAGVSAGTLNEALRLAQVRGTVTLRRGPGGGIFVGPSTTLLGVGTRMLGFEMSDHKLLDAMRVRNALDPLVIADAVDQGTPDDVTALRAIIEVMRRALWQRDIDTYIRQHWEFQRRIAQISPNAILRRMFSEVLTILDEGTVALADTSEPSEDSISGHVALHERMTQAITQHDRESALSVMRDYLASQGISDAP